MSLPHAGIIFATAAPGESRSCSHRAVQAVPPGFQHRGGFSDRLAMFFVPVPSLLSGASSVILADAFSALCVDFIFFLLLSYVNLLLWSVPKH